ncbi:MAG: polysaccharide biosynthesis tyrosine autokinase [Gammaproteobacteria bacterium]
MPTDLPHMVQTPTSPQAPQLPMDEGDDVISLGEMIATALEYKWLMLAVTGLAVILGAGWLFISTPIYQADALLQIEGQKGVSALKELQPLMEEDSTSVSSQLEIIKSRMILGRVVDNLKLDIVATPAHMPVMGAAMARWHDGPVLAEPLFGEPKYAWGGELIKVESLEVPRPLLGMRLTLVAGDNGRYQLLDDHNAPLLQGAVGEPAVGKDMSLYISQLKARPGTHFILTRVSQEDAINRLRANFAVNERVKLSGIIEATLKGADATQTAVILNDIINAYVRQNVEYRSAEAANTLKFLETQLPILKKQSDAAEAAYNNYRQSRGSVDLDIETQGVLASLVDLDKETVKLQQERDLLRQNFTPDHPRIQATDSMLERLKSKRSLLNATVSRLPDTQQAVVRLKRDVEVSNRLYTELLNTAQQLRVSKAGTVGDARIIDQAVVSSHPVEPKGPLIMGISLLLGLLASIVIIWLLRSLRVVVEDPEKIEQQLSLPVYASVPHSKTEIALSRTLKPGKGKGEMLAVDYPDDDAIESLRSLRATIHFALLDAAKGSILITGSRQGVGKSFISKNLGAVMAQSGKKVAIIDADLRKGHLHREFGMKRESGVSEFVSGSVSLNDILKPTQVPGLTLITTGQMPPNPSELLMHPRFEELLQRISELHDIVIVDAPPILAVSDAAIIGRLTGATLLVARAGMHPIRELEQAVKRLNQAGVQVKGFVFNDLDTTRQRYRYGYKGYVYRYTYKS